MRPRMPPPDGTRGHNASVYVLVRHDRCRFKLGWAFCPLLRAQQLPEHRCGALDLAASRAIWLPSRARAEQVERSVHKSLAPYRADAGHCGDGSHEWFAGHAQDNAMRLLGQMPLQPNSRATARLLPITLFPPPADVTPIETGPQDAWWRLEDLLERLVLHSAITVCGLEPGARPVVTVHGLRQMNTPEFVELRWAALDADSYQCRRDGRLLAFVQTIAWHGDDLVLSFAPMKVLERWEQGAELVSQVRGFLLRLARSANVPRPQ